MKRACRFGLYLIIFVWPYISVAALSPACEAVLIATRGGRVPGFYARQYLSRLADSWLAGNYSERRREGETLEPVRAFLKDLREKPTQVLGAEMLSEVSLTHFLDQLGSAGQRELVEQIRSYQRENLRLRNRLKAEGDRIQSVVDEQKRVRWEYRLGLFVPLIGGGGIIATALTLLLLENQPWYVTLPVILAGVGIATWGIEGHRLNPAKLREIRQKVFENERHLYRLTSAHEALSLEIRESLVNKTPPYFLYADETVSSQEIAEHPELKGIPAFSELPEGKSMRVRLLLLDVWLKKKSQSSMIVLAGFNPI